MNDDVDDGSTLTSDTDNAPRQAQYLSREGVFDTNTLVEGYDEISQAPELRKFGLNATIRQLHYSENKLALDNHINRAVDLLYQLITENKSRPIFYPTNVETLPKVQIFRSNKTVKSIEKSKLLEEEVNIPEFKVLQLKLTSHKDNAIINGINSLDKTSISFLLEQKLNQQVKFLLNLKDRIDDVSSKVLVTGDLNAGKSTFCNTLLRRKVFPEDQQPCTFVFCETIDASKENNCVEEVHAIETPEKYDIRDETTYSVFQLTDLERLVYKSDEYSLLKIYLNDVRPKEQSLLCNGVIDIRLIDAPGLNMDLYQTTQVFSRQEEIDLIVFVVNSENYFTLSGKEFISSATSDKQYLFIVANKFDNIKDKQRCKVKILDQVKSLSPESYKDSKDFVHFISSTEAFPSTNPDDPGGPGDDPEHVNPDFDNLEASLRKFVLEKRAISKLLPAKKFLLNILGDIEALANINKDLYETEKQSSMLRLHTQIAPEYNEIIAKNAKISDTFSRVVENTSSKLYDFTKTELNDSINQLGDQQIVNYLGIQYAYDYAQETQRKMINSILSAVILCEDHAKQATQQTVDEITDLGKSTLGGEFLHDEVFQADLMFTRKKDFTNKNLTTTIEFGDFFDPSFASFLNWLGIPNDLVTLSMHQLSYYNPTSIITKVPLTAITLREQLPSQLTLQTLYSSSKVLTVGALIRRLYMVSYVFKPSVIKKLAGPLLLAVSGVTVYYLISDIPNAFPRNQARKLKHNIKDLDYVHKNSDRISKECRKVLNYPCRQVMNNFQTSIDKRHNEKQKIEDEIRNANLSLGYFKELLDKVHHEVNLIHNVDLEHDTVD